MKTLVTYKNYPVNVTSAGSFSANFNLNTKDWHLLDGRINIETVPSLSFLSILFPPAGSTSNRPYSIRYGLSCKSDIPGVPVAEVENYSSTPITGNLNTSTAKWVNFPVNTYKMADFSFSPSDVYGYTNVDSNVNPYIGLGSQYWNEQYILLTIQPSWITPAISGISVSGTDPRQNITISWTANIQDLVDVKVSQGGVLKATLTGTTAKSIVMPAGTVGAGAYTVEIIAANNPIDDLGVTGTASANFTAIVPSPTVSNVTVNQTEIRNPITVSWNSTLQTDFIAELIQNDVVKATITGVATTSATFKPNVLSAGPATARATVRNTVGGISSSAASDYVFTATLSSPVITSLEPDNINNNVNLPILCTWNALKQEIYTLKLIQENRVLKIYNGTTAHQLNIPADTFESGACALELTVSNTVNGIIATSTKVSEFLGYGRPKIPVFNEQNIFNQALPIFKWTSEDQIAYKFSVWKQSELIEQSGEVISTLSEFHTTVSLENNTEYTIKVQTKNQFGLWSYVSEKNITTSYTQLTKPKFDLIPDSEGGILVNLDILEENTFSGAEIWRKEEYEDKFKRLAINLGFKGQWADYTIAANKTYYYKVVSKTLDGGRTESDIKSAKSIVRNFHFVNIEDTSRKLILKRNAKVSATNINDVALFMFAGRQAPVIQKGITNYKSFEMSFELDEEEFSMLEHIINTANVILYRDGRGRKAYGAITSSIKETPVASNLKKTIVSFTFTEISFIEEDIYSAAGGLKLRKFDGSWKFDGTVTFNGIAGWEYGI